MKHKVYLAGPISGLTYDGAQEWRDYTRSIGSGAIEWFSPLRGKKFLRSVGELDGSYTENPISTDRGIMSRDHNDCLTCDAILCNLLGAPKVSVGTVMEIAWSFAYRKPLVMVMEPDGDLHDHPMIREAISYRFSTLEPAIRATEMLLLP